MKRTTLSFSLLLIVIIYPMVTSHPHQKSASEDYQKSQRHLNKIEPNRPTDDKDESLSSCDNGWIDGSSVDMGCLVPLYEMGDLSQAQSTAACLDHSGHLVEILSQPQQKFLAAKLAEKEAELGLEGFVYYWMGLVRSGTGAWMWSQSNVEAGYTFWGDKEPSDGDCAQMDGTFVQSEEHGYSWFAIECEDAFGVFPVCQK